MAGLAVVIIGQFGALLPTFGALALVMLCLEAFARGHLRQFVTGLLAAAIAGAVAWLIVTEAVGNWRPAVAALLILAAVVLLGANIRDFRSSNTLPAETPNQSRVIQIPRALHRRPRAGDRLSRNPGAAVTACRRRRSNVPGSAGTRRVQGQNRRH